MSTPLAVGDRAPAFTLPDADNRLVSLSEYAGKRVIVYFYPAAMTAGCTIQAVDFTASLGVLRQAGFEVVGISPDSPERLAAFRQKEHLGLTLLADPQRSTLNAYGAFGTKMLYGKAVEGVIRSTFVVDVDADGEGTVTLAQSNVKAAGHVDRLKRELGVAEG